MVSGGTAPVIVFDYGKEVGGTPYFDITSETGSPKLQAGYSESSLYISATGDGSTPWGEGSEYTDQLDSVPAQSLPGSWSVPSGVLPGGALQASGPLGSTAVGLLNGGSSWGNYTDSFQTQVVDNQAGWVVRGQDANDGYAFVLNDSTDTSGTPNQLQEFDLTNGNYDSLGSVALPALPAPLVADTWHTVSTTVSGSTITVSLDGTLLTTLTNSAYSTGTVGFREHEGEEADFRNLTVTSSTGTSAYLKGALQLLGSYQLTSGFVTGALPPADSLSPTKPSGTTGTYSASYSTYWVLDLADYYMHSGDTAFVTQELPIVTGELAWDATQQDANSLAVLYGVAPAADDATLLAALKTDLWTTPYGPEPFTGSTYSTVISPYASGYEVDARLAANDAADAESLLTTEWGDMINADSDQTGTMWENISASSGLVGFGASSSLAHGWSTTPVSALSGSVLGVQPATGGYATWTVQPHPGNLSWAEGSVPTPHGTIAVDLAGESGVNQFSMQVTAPSGTTGTIAIPTYGATSPIVAVNGATVWSGGTFTATAGITGASADANYVYLTGVQPGTYTVAANPGNYGVPTGYTQCASENGTCAVTGTRSVAFGANGIYSYTTESASTACSTAALADPDYGIVKSCYTGPVTTGPSGTTYCGPENALCAFSGTRTVYFGAGTSWTSKSLSGGTPCTDAVFGDPVFGVVKACFLAPAS